MAAKCVDSLLFAIVPGYLDILSGVRNANGANAIDSVLGLMPLEVINSYAKQLVCQSDTNLVSLVMMREQAGAVYPTEQISYVSCHDDMCLVDRLFWQLRR